MRLFLLLSIIFIFNSCQNEHSGNTAIHQYLFLGHTYDWLTEDKLDPRLELLDYSGFKGIWLGGDICARSSKKESTLDYLDSIFSLSKNTTHWAIGNHDIMEGNVNKITAKTKRPTYYSDFENDLALLVINTNLFWHHEWDPAIENCEAKEAQMTFIQHFCDTLSTAKQLVVLHHHGIFNEKKINKQGDLIAPDNINAIPIRTNCKPESNLTTSWYPSLVKVQAKGIQVYCISGDVGMNSKKYHFQTQEGIHLLGSGINNSLDMRTPAPYVKNFNPDSVLIFNHWPEKDSLSWHFIRLNDLVRKQQHRLKKGYLSDRLKILLEKY